MRRSVLCLAVLLLAAWVSFRFASEEPRVERAIAQEAATPEAPARKAKRRDRFAVPEAREAAVLVQFVKALKELDPQTEHALAEYNEKAPAAMRQACERILQLDRDEKSAAHQFARRELLSHRIADLSDAADVGPATRKDFVDEATQFLKVSKRDAEDVELAVVLATSFEEIAPADEARSFYESLGGLFAQSSAGEIARRGQYLLGAARRLDIVGQTFELSGQTADGREFEIASLQGKVVLVDFWASWCVHCLQDMPSLRRHYSAYHDRGFEIVGVSVDGDREELEACLKKLRLPWPTLHDEKLGAEHPAATHYGIAGYPTTFLLGRDGKVLATEVRGTKLERKLKELLGARDEKPSPYPVFDIDEVLDLLTTTGAELRQAGKARGDAELRKSLDRTTCELTLLVATGETIPDREMYRRACESVFVVCSLYKTDDPEDWETSLATAFVVAEDGVLSTSCHVFDNEDEADAVVVMDVHKNIYPVTELLAANTQTDTCLFRIDATNLKPLPLAEDAVPGTPVRVLGHPGDSFFYLSSGHVANYERDRDGITWMNITAEFGQGSSGGPVLNEYGHVIGQVSRTFTLYAGGPATRGRPRRVANDKKLTDKKDLSPQEKRADEDIADPQMVFKSCVPVQSLRALVKAKPAPKAD